MRLARCDKGHYYDKDKFNACPHCSGMQVAPGETVAYEDPNAKKEAPKAEAPAEPQVQKVSVEERVAFSVDDTKQEAVNNAARPANNANASNDEAGVPLEERNTILLEPDANGNLHEINGNQEIKVEPAPEPAPEPTPEPTPEPVVEEVKAAESAPEPVVEEVKAEPVVEEVKAEPAPAPVVEEVKAEPAPEPVVEEVKAEPAPEPVVEEVKAAEPAPEPVVEEVKAEPAPEPVVEEVKAEAAPEPAVEEVKAEEPVAEANSSLQASLETATSSLMGEEEILEEKNTNPVVGYLVCINGQHKGASFNINEGRNFIGRATSNDICLSGNSSIQRERHAIITYDPRSKKCFLQPDETRDLIYVNDDLVFGPTPFEDKATVSLGGEDFKYIKLVLDEADWL